MPEFWQWIAGSSATVVLALLAGAGGSALLELLWRPRRDRRRAASLLLAEVALNTELLLLQAHARMKNPLGIPSDFLMSTIAWDAASGLVSELPPKDVRALVQLYAKYGALNRHVEQFDAHLEALEAASPGTKAYEDAATFVARTIDVFNTGLDSTLADGQSLLPNLIKLAEVKETPEEKAQKTDYERLAREHMDKRVAGTKAIKEAAQMGPSSNGPAA